MEQPGFSIFVDYEPGDGPVTNDQLPQFFPDVEKKTGIIERRIATHETVQTMAIHAIRKLLDTRGIRAKDCGGLVLSSCTGSPVERANMADVATYVATQIGIRGEIDGVNYACSGFPAAVNRALEISGDTDKEIVVVASEKLSSIVDWSDSKTAVLFADRAAATSIKENGHEIIHSSAWDVVDPESLIKVRHAHSMLNFDRQSRHGYRIEMNGLPLFKRAPGEMVELTHHSFLDNRLRSDEVETMIPHQANGRFIAQIIEILKKDFAGVLDHLNVINKIERMGNVGSASIPAALAQKDVWENLSKDKVVFCPTVGAGPNFAQGKLTLGILTFRMSGQSV
jgi:3-oxoacyl-(acyl-carrier-protein) synthase III